MANFTEFNEVYEWGPAPWIDPSVFWTLRFLFTGSSVFLSFYTIAYDWYSYYTGFQYFTNWGVHGTMLAFIALWLCYVA